MTQAPCYFCERRATSIHGGYLLCESCELKMFRVVLASLFGQSSVWALSEMTATAARATMMANDAHLPQTNDAETAPHGRG